MKRGGFMFLQKSKIQTVGQREKLFFSFFILEIPNFSYMDFFSKCLMLRRKTPLKNPFNEQRQEKMKQK